MIRLDDSFRYKGVEFKILKRGQKAVMLDAKADFYTCSSVEVWQLRESKDSSIKGNLIPAREKKPSNEDYPFSAHQFMENHFDSSEDMMKEAEKRFNQYETGERPRKIID